MERINTILSNWGVNKIRKKRVNECTKNIGLIFFKIFYI